MILTRKSGVLAFVLIAFSLVLGVLANVDVPNANDQCKLIYGEAALFCPEFQAVMCSQLACRVSPNDIYCNNITTIRAAEGTVCGVNQVSVFHIVKTLWLLFIISKLENSF